MSKPTIKDLKITNSQWKKKGDYVYIDGVVKNVSKNRTINYFEVEANFYDEYGDVIDSDWTNDGDELAPGESRPFDMMHKYNYKTENIRLSVREVS